jgi:hypothetical protein
MIICFSGLTIEDMKLRKRGSSRRAIWVGHVEYMRERRKYMKSQSERSEVLGKTGHVWKDSITMDLKEIGLKAWNELK